MICDRELLLNRFLGADEKKSLAKAILLAQDRHEESWNGNRYTKTYYQTATTAVTDCGIDTFWIEIIAKWIDFDWNGAMWWAEEYC